MYLDMCTYAYVYVHAYVYVCMYDKRKFLLILRLTKTVFKLY